METLNTRRLSSGNGGAAPPYTTASVNLERFLHAHGIAYARCYKDEDGAVRWEYAQDPDFQTVLAEYRELRVRRVLFPKRQEPSARIGQRKAES
jgi:hypothetical protein